MLLNMRWYFEPSGTPSALKAVSIGKWGHFPNILWLLRLPLASRLVAYKLLLVIPTPSALVAMVGWCGNFLVMRRENRAAVPQVRGVCALIGRFLATVLAHYAQQLLLHALLMGLLML